MSAKDETGTDSTARRPNYPIEAVDNVLRMLLLLAEQKHVRVSEASAELGIAVSTGHRMLAMLTYYDFVVQDQESKVYMAGPVLLRIGLKAVKNLDVRTLVHPFAEKLHEETGETVHVALLQGSDVLFIDGLESPNALRVASRVGTRMPAHCTSVGKAWLACESDEFLRALYPSSKLPALTPESITSRASLLAELAEVRERGYAHNESESEMGVGSVSTAIRDSSGKPVAAISLSVPLVRMPRNRWSKLSEAVQRTAREVEASLT